MEEKTSQKALEAMKYFEEGYNCCQAVFLAFCSAYELEPSVAARLSASFGGGVGRLREVCGAVSGMALVCGLECGAVDGWDQQAKGANYEQMQQLAAAFQEQNGSLICRHLLGLEQKVQADDMTGGMGKHQPQARTKEYYAARPCKELVGSAAQILEQWLYQRKNQEEIQ